MIVHSQKETSYMSILTIARPLFRHYDTQDEAIEACAFINEAARAEMPDLVGVFYVDGIYPEGCGCPYDMHIHYNQYEGYCYGCETQHQPVAWALRHIRHSTRPQNTPEDLDREARIQALRDLAERRWSER